MDPATVAVSNVVVKVLFVLDIRSQDALQRLRDPVTMDIPGVIRAAITVVTAIARAWATSVVSRL